MSMTSELSASISIHAPPRGATGAESNDAN